MMIEVKKIVSEWQHHHQLSGYDKIEQEGLLRNLLLRYSFALDELMVVVYATKKPTEIQLD